MYIVHISKISIMKNFSENNEVDKKENRIFITDHNL